MCFTFIGRIQTRLVTLIGPLLLAWLFTAVTHKPDYWTLFVLMVCVGLALDVGVYGWVIGYQPRWLTLGLAAVEFIILKWIMEWPYPFEIRLRTRQALELYLLAWIAIWLTLHVVLPLLWPRWVEDGGEFRPAWRRKTATFFKFPYRLEQRRRAYGRAILLLGIAGLPWLTAYLLTPEGYHYTGLLLMESGHLRALAHAATATIPGSPEYSITQVIGWLAHAGRWSLLPMYTLALGVTAFAWVLGFYLWATSSSFHPLLLIAPGIAPVLLLPLPWLCTAALIIWIALLLPWRWSGLISFPHQLIHLLFASTLLIWCLAWGRIAAAPLLYVDEAAWQAMIWLNQSVPSETTIAVPAHMRDLVAGFSGQIAVGDGEVADLQLRFGPECETLESLFLHGTSCIIEERQ
jgi:hypothetical protein